MSKAVKTCDGYVDRFREAFMAGVEGIARAAAIYVEAIDENPNFGDAFRDEFADIIPVGAWAGMEKVGRKLMHPNLLMGGGGKYASRIKRLPYSTQERVIGGERFDLLTADGQTLKVDVRQITTEQADQLFDGEHIRTLPEQRAWLESRKGRQVVEEADTMPYVIKGGKVLFRRGTTLSRPEIRRLLEVM